MAWSQWSPCVDLFEMIAEFYTNKLDLILTIYKKEECGHDYLPEAMLGGDEEECNDEDGQCCGLNSTKSFGYLYVIDY